MWCVDAIPSAQPIQDPELSVPRGIFVASWKILNPSGVIS
uniref:Uncharacterized protein n=1 Tax=Nonomuraea gerenzanensis TaxID=93944 RepID=A0A1M4EFQ5_9ACTN|nr:hypothetical protein BN4615_P7261 [Nonomuraea gerenzanensis]